MAKFSNPSKLSKEEQENLLMMFCGAVSEIKNQKEAAQFIKDLLSVQEAEMLAKRLKVAELLIEGKTYSQIGDYLKASPTTIARVHEWLKVSGDGFRLILERMKIAKNKKGESVEKVSMSEWRNIKRKYPLYFWPQLVLEEIIKTAKEKDRKRIKESLRIMDKKSALYKRLSRVMRKHS